MVKRIRVQPKVIDIHLINKDFNMYQKYLVWKHRTRSIRRFNKLAKGAVIKGEDRVYKHDCLDDGFYSNSKSKAAAEEGARQADEIIMKKYPVLNYSILGGYYFLKKR